MQFVNTLSTKKQVLMLFTFVPLVTIPLLVIIIFYSLQNINAMIVSNSQSKYIDKDKFYILTLLESMCYILSNKLKYYYHIVELISLNAEILNKISVPHPYPTPYVSGIKYNPEINWSEAYFHSDYYPDLSEESWQLINSSSILSFIFPVLKESSILWIYIGFASDEIQFEYPGTEYNFAYSPTSREWFYNACLNPGKIIVTEPYADAVTNELIITVSKALLRNDQSYGVVGIDLSLEYIRTVVSKIDIIVDILLLVSLKGCMIINPWNYPLESRVFQEEITGISSDLWKKILDLNFSVDSTFSFTFVNGKKYECYRNFVYQQQSFVTHAMIGCLDLEKYQKNTLNFQKSIQNYSLVFYIVLTIILVVTIINCVLVILIELQLERGIKYLLSYTRHIINNSLNFEIFRDKIHASNEQSELHTNRVYESEENSDVLRLENLKSPKNIFPILAGKVMKIKNIPFFKNSAVSLEDKLHNLDSAEAKFYCYHWRRTRPSEIFLYNICKKVIYPVNGLFSKLTKIRSLFIKCNVLSLKNFKIRSRQTFEID